MQTVCRRRGTSISMFVRRSPRNWNYPNIAVELFEFVEILLSTFCFPGISVVLYAAACSQDIAGLFYWTVLIVVGRHRMMLGFQLTTLRKERN